MIDVTAATANAPTANVIDRNDWATRCPISDQLPVTTSASTAAWSIDTQGLSERYAVAQTMIARPVFWRVETWARSVEPSATRAPARRRPTSRSTQLRRVGARVTVATLVVSAARSERLS